MRDSLRRPANPRRRSSSRERASRPSAGPPGKPATSSIALGMLAAALAAAFLVVGADRSHAEPEERKIEYQVVVNQEDQYVVFPADWDLPREWKPTGRGGTLETCHEYIEEVWTDMRPLSVRREHSRDADYQVIVNSEGQHAAWPVAVRVPAGWRRAARKGPLDECQAYIEEVWTDMRPLSVQRALSDRR